MNDPRIPPALLTRERRARLRAQLGDGVLVLPTAPEVIRNRDSHYPYRFDSDFYYLTGFAEPGAALVMIGGDAPCDLLFCRPRDPEREIWDGRRYGPEQARDVFGFDAAYPIDELDTRLLDLLPGHARLAWPLGHDSAWDARLLGLLNSVRARERSGVQAPGQLLDVRPWVEEMRLFKDADELARMQRAADISSEAHRRAMQATRPGRHEYEIEAELLHHFTVHGARSPAYSSIVAGGENACVLHYVENESPLRAGDLLLIDAGCEYRGYASDITRTFPVSGRFSGAQKAAYEIVLAAQLAAIDTVRPGASWQAPHEAALQVLTEGLKDLGVLSGETAGLIEQQAYTPYYMHRTGHWLGLDVHDAGTYKQDGAWRALQPGMCLTVEPGLYFRPDAGTPEAFWNIGIRIEDDVVVEAAGRHVLTSPPKTVAEIEAVMAHD
jgi:Xaa-Pro aminopeptidase